MTQSRWKGTGRSVARRLQSYLAKAARRARAAVPRSRGDGARAATPPPAALRTERRNATDAVPPRCLSLQRRTLPGTPRTKCSSR